MQSRLGTWRDARARTEVLPDSPLKTTTARPGFRSDINALRGIAVAAVVLYHFKVPGFAGGFVGVDMFFAISGFLMTGVVTSRMSEGSFSLLDFYSDRIRRIVPALAITCIAILLVALLWIDPLQSKPIGRSLISSTLFVSNFDYNSQGGYFGAPAAQNWLLHTWSLSVEWQFYLVFPVLMMVINRWAATERKIVFILYGAAILSLALCIGVLATRSDALLRASFYMLPMRAWELLAGGLVAAWRPVQGKIFSVSASIVGLVAIAGSIVFMDDGVAWPGMGATLPVLGTCLLLSASNSSPVWAMIPGLQVLGSISYSVYLLHWPILVVFKYFGWTEIAAWKILALVFTLGGGWLSYVLVERRLTQVMFAGGKSRGALLAISTMLVPLIGGAALWATNGLHGVKARGVGPDASARLAALQAAKKGWAYPGVCEPSDISVPNLDLCRVGGRGVAQTLVIGDSYAQQLAPRYAGGRHGAGAMIFATLEGCPPLPDIGVRGSIGRCAEANKAAFDLAASGQFRRVVLVGSWESAFAPREGEAFRGRLCFPHRAGCVTERDPVAYDRDVSATFSRLSVLLARLKAKGVDVTIISGFPTSITEASPERLYRDILEDPKISSVRYAASLTIKQNVYSDLRLERAATAAGVRLVEPVMFLCRDGWCPAFQDGLPVYTDGHHFTAAYVNSERFGFLDSILGPRS